MTRGLPVAALGLILGAGGCAPSLLHVPGGSAIAVPGEVPRDSKGEPVWSAIRPAPPDWAPTDARRPAPPPDTNAP